MFDLPTETAASGPTVTREAPRADVSKLFDNAVILQLEIRRLGTRRKVAAGDVETDADRRLLHVSKEILDSPELEAIRSADGALRAYVASRASGPAFLNRGGFHLLALPLVAATDDEITARLVTRETLIETFLRVYEERCAETRLRLGSLAPGLDEYPPVDAVRAAFGVSRRFLTFETPKTLEGIRRDLFDREATRAAAEWSAALDECKQVLRAAFADLVDHLVERLADDGTGKKKRFNDSLVSKFEDFAQTFGARNIADDRDLADLVTRARDIMANVNAKDLRSNEALRDAVARGMADVKAAIDPLVADVPTRMYSED